MDRQILYPGQIPLETDLLNTNRNVMVGLAMLAQDLFGTATLVTAFTCAPTSPATMGVLVNPGRIYMQANLDDSAYSSLPADTVHQVMKQGILLDASTLACPAPTTAGQSINYLIQVTYQDTDSTSVLLPYYNASNPTQAYTGPSNSGAAQFTVRKGTALLAAKAGIAATTGTQVTPAADAGYVPLFIVTVAYGAATITAGNISTSPLAPFMAAIDAKLRANLADPTTNTNGSGLIAWVASLVYPAGTVGYQLSLSQLRDGYADYLGKAMAAIYAGTATTIECYGDSTMWGADPNNSYAQVANPPPSELQNLLRTYYGNTAATVSNLAISGTTANQMILGTDGSGSTFAAKMAASTAAIVYCNHCINDAGTTGVLTTADVYKSNLIQFVTLARMNGKAPVLATPFMLASYGSLGTRSRSEVTKHFVNVMRQVAKQYNVPLVDNYEIGEKMLASGKYTPIGLTPDGVHPILGLYPKIGRNLAIPLVAPRGFTGVDQFISTSEACAIATNENSQQDLSSRIGFNISSGATASESIRALVLINEPKLDIYMAGLVFAQGATSFPINVDNVAIASTYSQGVAAFTTVAGVVHDHEMCIIENADAGLHYVTLPTSSVGFGSSINYFRSRQAFWSNPLIRQSGGAAGQENYRRLLVEKLEMVSTPAITILPDIPTPRLIRDFEFEFVSTLQKSSGVIVNGLTVGLFSGASAGLGGITIGLNASGFLTVWEQTSPSGQASSVLGAVDLSVASHIYYVRATAGRFGTINVYVDSTLIGTYTCTMPWWGGFLGFWKGGAGGTLTINSIYQMMRL